MIASAIFWTALGLAAAGTLQVASGDQTDPEPHKVQIDCTSGKLVDVLRAGAPDDQRCYAILP